MKSIVYDGIKFIRDNITGYYLSTKRKNGVGIRLHVYVWEQHNGKVPSGYDVHHKDGHKNNNDISNLEILSRSEHQSKHWENRSEEDRQEFRERFIKNAHPKAKEWHKSEKGRAWHSEHAKRIAENIEEREYRCENCKKVFYKKPFGVNKFCSNACRAAFRRKSGVDNVIRECAVCGEKFEVNKYAKTQTCSASCANVLTWKKRQNEQ